MKERTLSDLDGLKSVRKEKINPKDLKHIPEAYAECGRLTRANLKEERTEDYLPIYMGVSRENDDKVFFSLGAENPFVMSKREALYLAEAVMVLFKENYPQDIDKFRKEADITILTQDGFINPKDDKTKIKEMSSIIADLINQDGAKKGDTGGTEASTEQGLPSKDGVSGEAKDIETQADQESSDRKQLEQQQPDDEESKQGSSKLPGVTKGNTGNSVPKEIIAKIKELAKKLTGKDLSDEEIKQIEDQKKDLDVIMEGLSPDEKEELQEEVAKEEREALYQKASDFEKELLGEIRIEEPVEYSYEYFKAIFDKDGVPALKEEMAKLPKPQRQEMIDKIMKEYEKQAKQD